MHRLARSRYGRGHVIESGDGEQPQPDQEQPRHRTALEGHLQGRIEAAVRRLGGPDIRPHGDLHPDVPGRGGGHRADEESDGRQQAELLRPEPGQPEDREQPRGHVGDRRVLAIQVGIGPFLDGLGDGLHLLGPLLQLQDPLDEVRSISDPNERGHDSKQHNPGTSIHANALLPLWNDGGVSAADDEMAAHCIGTPRTFQARAPLVAWTAVVH